MEKNNSHFSLDQIAATANYKSGLPSTRKYTTVDLGKPGPDDWFKGYDLGKGFDSFTTAWITNKKDAEGRKHPYLIAGPDEDFNNRIKYLMMHPFDFELAVPLETSSKYGDNWLECK